MSRISRIKDGGGDARHTVDQMYDDHFDGDVSLSETNSELKKEFGDDICKKDPYLAISYNREVNDRRARKAEHKSLIRTLLGVAKAALSVKMQNNQLHGTTDRKTIRVTDRRRTD